MLLSASSAARVCGRGRVERDRRRRLAVEGQREGAARRAVDAHGLRLGRLHVVVRREAARVAAAGGRVVTRDEPQVVVLVEVDVAGDVAARAAVVGDLEDLLLGREVERRVLTVDELEAAELEVARPGVRPHARVGGRRRRRAGRGRHVGHRAVALLDADGRRRVVQVHPLVGGEVVVDRRAVEAVLGVGVDRDRWRSASCPLDRVVQAHLAARGRSGGCGRPGAGRSRSAR